jgi:CRISPR/Cas system Type II protein with McrA/HNH and RuvC-like nuclease domain
MNKKRMKYYAKFNGKCIYCGCSIEFNNFEIDHIKPKSKGGKDDEDNLVASYIDCYRAKSNKTLREFKDYIEDLGEDLWLYNNKFRLLVKYYKNENGLINPMKKIDFHFNKLLEDKYGKKQVYKYKDMD